MSEELDQAVGARIDAHRPRATPPFEVIEARKRRRDRGRLAVAATALGVTAVGSLTTAVLQQGSTPRDRLGDVPTSSAPAPVAPSGAAAPDLGPPPRAFVTRPELPDCGTHSLGQSGGETVPAEARQCLADGARNGRGAELAERQPTVEGDPIVTYTRALPDGSAEVFRDMTADAFGDRVWTHAACAQVSSAGRVQGCGAEEILLGAAPGEGRCPQGETSAADYGQFVRVGSETYVLAGEAPAASRLGVTVLEVHCQLSEGARPAGDPWQSGDASYLPVGTPVLQVLGFDPRFRLAVRTNGQVQLLERPVPTRAGSAYREAFPGVVDRIRGVVVLDRDKDTQLGRLDAPGVQRVRQALAVGYYAPGSATRADRFVRLELDDGSTVVRAYDAKEGILFPGVRLTAAARASLAAGGS